MSGSNVAPESRNNSVADDNFVDPQSVISGICSGSRWVDFVNPPARETFVWCRVRYCANRLRLPGLTPCTWTMCTRLSMAPYRHRRTDCVYDSFLVPEQRETEDVSLHLSRSPRSRCRSRVRVAEIVIGHPLVGCPTCRWPRESSRCFKIERAGGSSKMRTRLGDRLHPSCSNAAR
jgi:hypothetical protein